MQHHSISSTRGFTLAETLVVIALVSIVGVALQYAIQYFYRANAYVLQSTAAINSARNGVTTMTSHMREATYGDDGSFPLSNVSTSSITFFSDVDRDGGVERVKAYLIGQTFYRVVTNAGGAPLTYSGQTPATSTLATYVKNGTSTPIFRYYDDSGTELTGTINLTEVSSISITLKVDVNPLRAPEIYTLTQRAMLRNLESE